MAQAANRDVDSSLSFWRDFSSSSSRFQSIPMGGTFDLTEHKEDDRKRAVILLRMIPHQKEV